MLTKYKKFDSCLKFILRLLWYTAFRLHLNNWLVLHQVYWLRTLTVIDALFKLLYKCLNWMHRCPASFACALGGWMSQLPAPSRNISRSSAKPVSFNKCKRHHSFISFLINILLFCGTGLLCITKTTFEFSDHSCLDNGTVRKKASHVPLMSRPTERESYSILSLGLEMAKNVVAFLFFLSSE